MNITIAGQTLIVSTDDARALYEQLRQQFKEAPKPVVPWSAMESWPDPLPMTPPSLAAHQRASTGPLPWFNPDYNPKAFE